MYVGRLELLPWQGKLISQDSRLKLGADILNSRDDAGTNISQALNLKVDTDGSLTPFVLPSADKRTAWSLDAWLNIGQFDLIGEYPSEDLSTPRLLLLDEPMSSLDSKLKGKLIPFLLRIRDEFRIPLIYVTHDAAELTALCDEVLVLEHGRIISRGPPAAVLA